jgi:arabinogalactan endo-1,4-beta-galactosidase
LQAQENTASYSWKKFSMGVDLSYVNEIEDYGGFYIDKNKKTDPYTIFKTYGANTVRVRLWHNPEWIGKVTGGKIYAT